MALRPLLITNHQLPTDSQISLDDESARFLAELHRRDAAKEGAEAGVNAEAEGAGEGWGTSSIASSSAASS